MSAIVQTLDAASRSQTGFGMQMESGHVAVGLMLSTRLQCTVGNELQTHDQLPLLSSMSIGRQGGATFFDDLLDKNRL